MDIAHKALVATPPIPATGDVFVLHLRGGVDSIIVDGTERWTMSEVPALHVSFRKHTHTYAPKPQLEAVCCRWEGSTRQSLFALRCFDTTRSILLPGPPTPPTMPGPGAASRVLRTTRRPHSRDRDPSLSASVPSPHSIKKTMAMTLASHLFQRTHNPHPRRRPRVADPADL